MRRWTVRRTTIQTRKRALSVPLRRRDVPWCRRPIRSGMGRVNAVGQAGKHWRACVMQRRRHRRRGVRGPYRSLWAGRDHARNIVRRIAVRRGRRRRWVMLGHRRMVRMKRWRPMRPRRLRRMGDAVERRRRVTSPGSNGGSRGWRRCRSHGSPRRRRRRRRRWKLSWGRSDGLRRRSWDFFRSDQQFWLVCPLPMAFIAQVRAGTRDGNAFGGIHFAIRRC